MQICIRIRGWSNCHNNVTFGLPFTSSAHEKNLKELSQLTSVQIPYIHTNNSCLTILLHVGCCLTLYNYYNLDNHVDFCLMFGKWSNVRLLFQTLSIFIEFATVDSIKRCLNKGIVGHCLYNYLHSGYGVS